jgi:hypothetical protein
MGTAGASAFHPLRKFGSEFLCLIGTDGFRQTQIMPRTEGHVGLVGLIATWQGADPPHARSDLDRLVDEVLGLADVLQGYAPVPDVGSSYEGAYQNSMSPVSAARPVLAN